jgi:hypothetical protein
MPKQPSKQPPKVASTKNGQLKGSLKKAPKASAATPSEHATNALRQGL